MTLELAGVSIHARCFAIAADYASPWSPTAGGEWIDYGTHKNAWRHRRYPRCVVWKPTAWQVVVMQLVSSAPSADIVEELARVALGAHARSAQVVSYPVAIRLPMVGPGKLEIPEGGFLCRRLWPAADEPAWVEMVDGVPVELRISGSAVNDRTLLYAEALVGGAHETSTGRARSLLYAADARRVFRAPGVQRVEAFTCHVMDRLLGFAVERGDLDLHVGHHPVAGEKIGVVQIGSEWPGRGEPEFAVRLPQPSGPLTFTGSFYTR